MDQGKTYKVTYRVYYNEKIKQVSFHGKWLYPLYLQLIYDRRNTVYKCNLFNLFLKPKYAIRVAGEIHAPRIEEVIRREEKLIEFIIDKHPDDFSFDVFKQEYDYYSRDLLDEMEPGFMKYLHTFLQDEGIPYLADSLNVGEPLCHLGDVVSDMQRALKSELFARLVEHSFAYAPPYLPLFRFCDSAPQRSLISLTVKDWEDQMVKDKFADYVTKVYEEQDASKILNEINDLIKAFKRDN
jgi:hypothetical protein